MIEFYNLVKQLEKEKSELENILASSIVELEKAGLNTDKFEDTIFYTNSATDDIEEANEYAYIERMIGCHNIEYMVENKESSCISDYNKLKKLIEDWISSLSVRETLSDEEIDNQIEEAKKYFLEVLQDYKLADIDSDYFIERFNDDIKIIGKDRILHNEMYFIPMRRDWNGVRCKYLDCVERNFNKERNLCGLIECLWKTGLIRISMK